MNIRDFESGKDLTDVSISLTREELVDLQTYIGRLLNNPEIKHVHLSEFQGCIVTKEISFEHKPTLQ